ncbi:acrylyl-CoA reductase (NADPH) [Gammaproteobacteria bacterium]|nr:YhdH/YhfP family quinone oxidoreductase [Gammaproteobacteria bacterium]QOJ32887.1 MAG: YhdH/YhfP family quinone oxidoreductase [Gammaproteobacteria bacterium]CAG0943529.1 acrylyl-CoA reductase (NADPH) [Gammaproteobacteria bacterium]
MKDFRALRVHLEGERIVARLERLRLDDLSAGEVVIRTAWSSINYKDALAATGKGRILRRYPLVAGVDLAGTVESSSDPRFRPGDAVVSCGCGLSEIHDGGFSEIARLPGDVLTPLPPGLDLREAMAIGTAGFTAAYALHRMEQNGQHPGLGPLAVTGATGGVGSVAIDIFSRRGYRVTALTHKPGAEDYLRSLGASDVQALEGKVLGTRPLEKAVWGGAVDNLGGSVLAWLTRSVVPLGNIASIGLAAGPELQTTVMPFILRGVSLLGISSADAPRELRSVVWQRLGADLKPAQLGRIASREVGIEELPACFDAYIEGRITGRTLVRLG